MRKHSRGFSFIEVVMTMGIVTAVSGAVFPSVKEHVYAAHRAEAKAALFDAAHRLERYLASGHVYDTATIGSGNKETDVLPAALTYDGNYTMSLEATDTSRYLIVAKRNGKQVGDVTCGDLTLDATGRGGIVNARPGITAARCWGL